MLQPCKKCLLSDIDFDSVAKNILEYVKSIPEELRTEEGEYQRRLEICRRCGQLQSGMCLKCGCYVELRAAKPNNRCPSENKYW